MAEQIKITRNRAVALNEVEAGHVRVADWSAGAPFGWAVTSRSLTRNGATRACNDLFDADLIHIDQTGRAELTDKGRAAMRLAHARKR